jgi:serine/threonine-protein kinase
LKPENLMIVRDPESAGGERIKVLDFGIARLTADLRSGDGTTETGIVLGTPMYMSPEQCHGAKQVTPQSDVYSLGIILYKMLAGRTPFTSPGLGALIAMHLTEVPPRVEQYNRQVPPPLSALLSEMLAKSPAERPTMSEVEERLRAMSSSEELPAPRSRNEAATQKLSPVALLALTKAQAGIDAAAVRPKDQHQQQTMLLPLRGGPQLHSQPTGVLLTPRGRTRRLLRYLMAVSALSLGAFVLVMVRGFAGQTSSAGAPPSLSMVPGPSVERTAPSLPVQDFATAPAVNLATGADLLPVQRASAKAFVEPRERAPSPIEPSSPTPSPGAVPAAPVRPTGLASSGPSGTSSVAAPSLPDMASPSGVAAPPRPYTKLPTGLRDPFSRDGKTP